MAFNRLTDDQNERLALLAEELGEAVKAIGKIQRHGYASRNPFDPRAGSNRDMLTTELGDVAAAVALLVAAGDLSQRGIDECRAGKLDAVGQWLHHQPVRVLQDAKQQPTDNGAKA